MKTLRKTRRNGLGYIPPRTVQGFDWKGAMQITTPDEKIDKSGGFPPALNAQPRSEGKVYAKVITILWHEGTNNFENAKYTDGYGLFRAFEAIYKEEIEKLLDMGKDPKEAYGYTKMKIHILFTDGKEDEFRADVSPKEFNPYNFKNLHDYVVMAYGPTNELEENYYYTFQGFENPNFKKEPVWKQKPEVLAKIRAEEERRKKENPEGYRFRGSNYNNKLSTAEIAKAVRTKIAEKYPYMVISVRMDSFSGGSSIDGTIKDFGFNPFIPKFEKHIMDGNSLNDWRDEFNRYSEYYTPKAKKILEECEAILNSYNFDDSDSQSDYSHRNFYGRFTIDTDSLIKLYMPDSKYAIDAKKSAEESKQYQAKVKAKIAERKSQFTYKYGDLVLLNVNWRGQGQKQEFALISKVPNGTSKWATSYTVDIIRPLSPEKEKEKLDWENERKTASYEKNRRNKYIGVTYIEGKPYGYLQAIDNESQERLKPYEGNWTHWLKEAQLKEQKEAEAKAQLQAQRKAQAEAKKAQPKPAKPTPAPKASVTKPATAISKPSASNDVTIRKNEKLRGIEIIFGSFPSNETRTYIKSIGFKWNNNQKLWYTNYTEATWKKVNEKFGQSEAPNMAFIMARAKAKLKLLALKF